MGTKRRILSLSVATLLLAIFLVAKIPSSQCHCQDPVKSQEELCPFGVLRTLVVVPTLAPDLPLVELIGAFQLLVILNLSTLSETLPPPVKSRDPPSSSL